jgi:hypothetical protein
MTLNPFRINYPFVTYSGKHPQVRVKSLSPVASTYLFTFLTLLTPESRDAYSHIFWSGLCFLTDYSRFCIFNPSCSTFLSFDPETKSTIMGYP